MTSMRILSRFFWSVATVWIFFGLFVERVLAAESKTRFVLESPLKNIGGIDTLVKVIIDKIILPIGASVAALFIIYAGFLYVKAQGDTTKLKEARAALTNALIGTAIILGAWVIAELISGTITALKVP